MAQIDPRIAMGFQPTHQIESPMNNLARLLQVQGAQQANQMNQLKLDEAAYAGQRRNKLASLLQGQYDTDEARESALTSGGFLEEAQGMAKSRLANQKTKADTAKTEADTEKQKLQTAMERVSFAGQLLGGVRDQATYDQARVLAQQSGMDVSQMPPQYDPAMVEQKRAQALSYAQQLEQEWKKRDFGHKERQQGEIERHNKQTEATARGQLGVAQGNLRLRGEELEFNRQQPKGMLDQERGLLVDPRTGQARPVTMGGKPVGAKQSPEVKKELLSINQQRSAIDGAIDAVRKTPSAFSFGRGLAGSTQIGESLAGRGESKDETVARGYVFNNVSRIINERAGAAQSAQELARLNSFLPAPTDNADQIVNKLDGFKQYLSDMERGTLGGTPAPSPAAAPAGFKIISVEE